MKKSYLLALVVVLFFTSCKQTIVEYDNVQTLNFNQEQSIDPSNILEMDFIKLETNENCLIDKTIRQVNSALGKLFVLTGGNGKLLTFDSSGKFIASIGNTGNGPGEYMVLTSFSIDCHRNIISAVDMAQKKIINYNLIDYGFISEQKIEDFTCFEYLGNNKIVWQNVGVHGNYAGWNFIVTDTNQKYIDKYVKNDLITGYHTAPLKNMYKHNDELITYTEYHPFVYRFREDSIYPLYKLEFGKHKLPPLDYLERVSSGNVNFLRDLEQSNYVCSFSVFGANDIFIVYYSISNIYNIGVYDNRNNRIYNYTMEDFQKKLKISKIDNISGVVNNSIAAVILPFHLLDREDNYPLTPKLQDLTTGLKEDDNPILFLFKLKN
jgi:hypothetical protein